ncbi:uncharacterized protein ko [Anabrus simplex]|uniref:uncharacterized protein ko n=1 Tax=Anabrus simplex TaxID=316456 RepID=UPI0035A2D839
MSGRSPGLKGLGAPPGGSRCLVILQRCLAIQLQKVGLVSSQETAPVSGPATEYWMYDSGYLLFQGFLEANLKCFWNASLLEAMRLLEFQGYVAPGVLLVTASACALEVVRAAWARNVLKPPNNYIIAVVGDIEDCLIQPLPQGQFTPLPEALCWVILDLTSSGQAAVLERIRSALQVAFPDIEKPSPEIVYDALAKLMADRKVYQTSQGYFVVTPERRRRDSSQQRRHSRSHGGHSYTVAAAPEETRESRQVLMSTEEALAYVHGEMATIRDGDVTHQAVQTNLADVICGGNPNDKVLYPRPTRRSSSFPLGRLERRHSLRLFGSSKRLSSSLSRCGSLRHIPNKNLLQSDSSSSTEDPAVIAEHHSPKKVSLLSRIFRRSNRKRGSSAPPPLATFSAQFPPTEWFNPRVVHLHSVGTQTRSPSSTANSSTAVTSCRNSLAQSHGSIQPWTDEEVSSRAATLPRRHRRHLSGDSATSLVTNPQSQTVITTSSSTPRSSRRHRSPSQSSTIPRRSSSSHSTSRTSVHPHGSPAKHASLERHNQSPSQGSVVTSNHSTPNKTNTNQSGSIASSHSSKSATSSPCKSLSNHSSKNSPSNTLLSTSSNRSSPSKVPLSSTASATKSNSSSRNCSPAKSKTVVVNGVTQPNAQKVEQPGGPSASKNSITLQVSTTNRSSPPSSSGYSSQYQSSTGRSSVMSSASTAPFQDSPTRRSVTVTSETPTSYGIGTTSSTTTTTTVNSSNTKIYVQQQNSPVRSVITFENGVKNNVNGCSVPNQDIIIINGAAPDQNTTSSKESAPVNTRKCQENAERQRPKLERPTSLYSPREVLKSSIITEKSPGENEDICKATERRKFPSVESLNCSEIMSNNKSNLTNSINFNNQNNSRSSDLLTTSSNTLAKINTGDACNTTATHHPNSQPPSTSPTSSNPTMNNARVLPAQSSSPALVSKSKENLCYKNVLRNESFSSLFGNREGLKNNCCSHPASPTKSFDGFGGSYGNLYIEHLDGTEKLLSASMKRLEEHGRSNSDLCPYPSLSDLTVHFKSIAAQKILKGVSINSIDTLVEVNMAAAEKQNNCDVTIHTDFGMV